VSSAKSLASKLFWAAKEREDDARRAVSAARRAALTNRLRTEAAWKRATVDLDIARDAHLGPGIRIHVDPGMHSRLSIGSGAILDGRCRINLRGGTVSLGERSVLREGVVLNVSGTLEIGDQSLLSYGTIVHCAEQVSIGPLVGIAEYVTIVDSAHFLTEPDVRHIDNVRTKAVSIGHNTWLCPKATVTSGVSVGNYCVVSAGVTLTRDVPDGHSVGQGQVAQRRRSLPWESLQVTA
jgi:acetyltransferase-like isoleucine patch superfamily enzyme